MFDAEAVTHVDSTGLDALADLRDALRRENVELVVARAKTPLLDTLAEAGFEVPFYPTVRAAVEACAPKATA